MPKPRNEPSDDSQLSVLQREVEKLNRRVNAQDSRLDNIESNMSQQHSEVMQALRSLGASSSPSTVSKKREPELPNTPLRALTQGEGSKISKGKGSK
jgi:septal ring factor EnvC (AmiA/AmiB activator)